MIIIFVTLYLTTVLGNDALELHFSRSWTRPAYKRLKIDSDRRNIYPATPSLEHSWPLVMNFNLRPCFKETAFGDVNGINSIESLYRNKLLTMIGIRPWVVNNVKSNHSDGPRANIQIGRPSEHEYNTLTCQILR